MNEERRAQSGIEVKLEFIIKELDEIKLKLERNYVSQEEFKPVKNLVYGIVSIILTAVIVAFVALIIKQ